MVLLVGLGVLAGYGAARWLAANSDKQEDKTDYDVILDKLFDHLTESGVVGRKTDWSDPLLEQRIILVCESINEITAKDVCNRLLYLNAKDPNKPIDLYLKTFGGWQADALLICDVMQRIQAPVNTWALSNCESSGAMVLVAGTGKRRATPNSLIMLHVVEKEGHEDYSFD